MPDFHLVTRPHVLAVLQEYDSLGQDEFLSRYGFGRERGYVLRHEGRSYDSKAILGVALRGATGRAARSSEFSGGKDGAAKWLTKLEFEVSEAAVGQADERATAVCPMCFVALPATGVCDDCG